MEAADTNADAPVPALSRNHLRRLRQYYRSAGWPCHDTIELDLLERGLIERTRRKGDVLESLVVTEDGIRALARSLDQNRRARAEHDALVDRVARQLHAQRRLVFRGIAMRARIDDAWQLSRPDVFSVRHVVSSRHLQPVVHEIKVRRADLLGDLKNDAKRRAYQSYSQAFYYVIAEGIADPAEIPADCGVIVAERRGLRVARSSPQRKVTLTTSQWVVLARTGAEHGPDDEPQLSF